ncbi:MULTISPECIES: acyl carrier protein [Pseudovibrio]|uniref:acyl carrier protein n=1 Tax=Stappiaceae TaxID=2821832 RepID=UPI002366075B|nr:MULTISPECIES: acyl carrier protein [Pseudovibrio]MDD7910801.1 acyl carrier protein [Pseudovibrio exalbescens]MDX5593491.1 acyl carrier protein [Pseudovibrio sp. SPO723]
MTYSHEIRSFICSELTTDVSADEIPEDYDLLASGVLDSLALVRLIAWLGETFSLPINEMDLAPEDFLSVKAIDDFILKHEQKAVA